uniref:SCP domain-containing protein n=1 Tax=Mesocestoides corti TaxID=53468 RepID=A0A5K3EFQ2_MESCO
MQISHFLLAVMFSALVQALVQEDRCTILEQHTKLREDVNPEAKNMLLMNYSLELEKLADDWLANCTFQFPYGKPGFHDIGYVLLLGSQDQPVKLDMFTKIGSDRQFCKQECLVYKQMVWATANQVGCAHRQCKTGSNPSALQYYLACFYQPVGLIGEEKPYETGSSCTDCPNGMDCFRKQCANLSSLSSDSCSRTPPKQTPSPAYKTAKTTSSSKRLAAGNFLTDAVLISIVAAFLSTVTTHI